MNREAARMRGGDGKLKRVINKQIILGISHPVISKPCQSKVLSERNLLFAEEMGLISGPY